MNLDTITNHMVEVIEMLKNNNDPQASENEKIDVNSAKTIAELGKNCIEAYKTKVQLLNIISKTDNRELTDKYTQLTGIMPTQNKLGSR